MDSLTSLHMPKLMPGCRCRGEDGMPAAACSLACRVEDPGGALGWGRGGGELSRGSTLLTHRVNMFRL